MTCRSFFFNVFAKGEKVNLSKAERNELTKILADIADVYRKGVRRKCQRPVKGF